MDCRDMRSLVIVGEDKKRIFDINSEWYYVQEKYWELSYNVCAIK